MTELTTSVGSSGDGPDSRVTLIDGPSDTGEPRGPLIEVAVPVHNEEKVLEGSIRRLHAYLAGTLPYRFLITIADNASTDRTWEVAQNLAREIPEVEAVHLNLKGRGRALRQVWDTSIAEVVAYMDVDLSTDLDAFLPLIAPLVTGHSDLAIGSRLSRGSAVVRGPKREFISRTYFFGFLDAGSYITVDKPPMSLWVMGLSARAFGFNAWSILLPQAVEGVATVAVLYAAVRRAAGPVAGLVAALVLTLTPMVVAINRDTNPDTLLVLLLVVAAWACLAAVGTGGPGYLVLCGVAVGCAFNTKMLQAFIALPALALVYLLSGQGTWVRRIRHLLAAAVALAVSGLWWLLIVDLIPASSRPYVGSSRDGTVLNLALGYNGAGRILGGTQGNSGPLPSRLVEYLIAHQGGATWLVAVSKSSFGAPLILQTGRPVMAIGGFSGRDNAMTVPKLQGYIKTGRLHYVLLDPNSMLRGTHVIAPWVQRNCATVNPVAYGSASSPAGQTLYRCESPYVAKG
jgi:hypothetical protein